MKELLTIVKQGSRNPRFFVESLNVKWRHLLLLSLISILAIAGSIFVNSLEISHTIISNIKDASQFIPEFEITNNNLVFTANEKPLYYQSDYFQLIIDDQIDQVDDTLNFEMNRAKAQQINSNTLVNLFVFRKHAYILINQTFLKITEIHQPNMNKAELLTYLDFIDQFKWVLYLSLFITGCLFALFNYLFMILFASFLTGIFNIRLSPPIGFKLRLKASIAISLIPILLVECINMIFPLYVGISTSLIVFLVVAIYYLMFKHHTKYILEILSKTKSNHHSKS